MVMAFQSKYQLPATGIVDIKTWNKMKEVYNKILTHLPQNILVYKDEIYPGISLSLGMQGAEVTTLQQFLQQISKKSPNFPQVNVLGCFDTKTESAVKEIQKEANLVQNGHVGPLEWQYIVEKSKE